MRNGFSLVEQLIGLLLVSLTLISATRFVSQSIGVFWREQQYLDAQIEIKQIAAMISFQLRSAHINQSNHSKRMAYMQIGSNPSNLSSSCILFGYDHNFDNTITTTAPKEHFGYRIHNNAIEYRMGDRRCQEGFWQDITSPDLVHVSQFVVTPINQFRGVKIFIEARPSAMPNEFFSETIVVWLRNFAHD